MAPLRAFTIVVEYNMLSPTGEDPRLFKRDIALLATDMSS
jgi:hypothetical protein